MPDLEVVDAIVVGGNTRGLVAAYLLGSLGYRTVLIEKGGAVGGMDRSFETAGGSRFELGMHVLDEMRSKIATRLFTHVVDGAVHRVELARAIVLRDRVIPYAPHPSQMPEEIRSMLLASELVDDIGDALPTRESIARCYGSAYADLIFDEVLPSYPSESRHLEFGVDESRLMTNIYPWFFPRARRATSSSDESRSFHDRLRSGMPQHVLYPRSGSFGGFVDGFLRQLSRLPVEVLTGASDLQLDLEPDGHRVKEVRAGTRRFTAPDYFWAASWPDLCGRLGLACQDTATDRFVLGSFRLSEAALSPYQEILVGDPNHRINRITLPARFRESNEPLLQVEFAFPKLEPAPLDEAYWVKCWTESLQRLGLLSDRHRVEEFDFKTFVMHFNAFGMEGVPLEDADPALLHPESNIRPIVPSMANLNLNAHVPRDIDYVVSTLTSLHQAERA